MLKKKIISFWCARLDVKTNKKYRFIYIFHIAVLSDLSSLCNYFPRRVAGSVFMSDN